VICEIARIAPFSAQKVSNLLQPGSSPASVLRSGFASFANRLEIAQTCL
jgi:hypothetical protein